MADYEFYKEGAGVPYTSGGNPFMKRRLDIPDLVANAKLALTSAPGTPVNLPSTGFAASDTLELFQVPKGALIKRVGLYVVTGEGAACTIDIGVNSATSTHSLAANDDGWEAAGSIQTAGVMLYTLDNDEFGSDNMMGQLFITDGNINVLFNSADTETAVVDFWVEGYMASAIDA